MPRPRPRPRDPLDWLSGYPLLCAQLDREHNDLDLDPDEIRRGSGRRLWWRCPEGPDHLWEQRVNNRTSGSGCPACAGIQVSVTNCLSTRNPEVAAQWHPTLNELEPTQVVAGSSMEAWFRCPVGPDHVWKTRLFKRTLDGLGCPFCAGFQVSVTNNLATLYPELAKQWHSTRNGRLRPDQVVAGSTRRVWWRCARAKDHVWEASLHDRTAGGTGCPYCANVVVSSTNSVATLAPALVAEWDEERNGVPASEALGVTKAKAWWRCAVDPRHRFAATVRNRVLQGSGCPYCQNRARHPTNTLARVAPQLAAGWHPTLNGRLTPEDVVAGGRRRVWWVCPRNSEHVWQGTLTSRMRAKQDCPFCRHGAQPIG
ncbi:MAG: zinc-ribbon domain-containing protein [Myxococcales bacterium]|nr:zinc-ribbon domain-containing protein [Myxococcales bacterium]